jgi:hypothetical protein
MRPTRPMQQRPQDQIGEGRIWTRPGKGTLCSRAEQQVRFTRETRIVTSLARPSQTVGWHSLTPSDLIARQVLGPD